MRCLLLVQTFVFMLFEVNVQVFTMNTLIVVGYAFLFLGLATVTSTSIKPLILTPYIERNESAIARNASRVDPSKFLNISSYSGFLTVDVAKNSNLFFWHFPVVNKPLNTTPWIIWLQGGPGASSLTGLFKEIGPFAYENDTLKLREWTWCKEYSVLFIDNPVGAGFSFTDNINDGLATNMDQVSEHLYGALQQFLEVFPEHRHAPLYLAGESYAGHYIPALAQKILHPPPELKRTNIKDTSINLQGLMLGSPMIDHRDEADLTSVYYQMGLLDRQGMLAIKPLEDQYKKAIEDNNNELAFKLRNDLIDRLMNDAYQDQTYNIMKDNILVEDYVEFIYRPDINQAIHVASSKFDFSNHEVHLKLIPDFLDKASTRIEQLLEHYRVLIFCGQLDVTVPYVPNAEARRKNWRWSHREDFLNAPRLPWGDNQSVAGYVKSGGGLTEVLVRGAGHLIPMDQPAHTYQLVTHFIRGLDLPLPPNVIPSEIKVPPYTDEDTEPKPSQNVNGMVASAILNVILVLIIILGIVYWVRWKRRTETYFYNLVDNSSLNDGVLTMN